MASKAVQPAYRSRPLYEDEAWAFAGFHCQDPEEVDHHCLKALPHPREWPMLITVETSTGKWCIAHRSDRTTVSKIQPTGGWNEASAAPVDMLKLLRIQGETLDAFEAAKKLKTIAAEKEKSWQQGQEVAIGSGIGWSTEKQERNFRQKLQRWGAESASTKPSVPASTVEITTEKGRDTARPPLIAETTKTEEEWELVGDVDTIEVEKGYVLLND